ANEKLEAFLNALANPAPVETETFGGFAINVYLPTVEGMSYKWKKQVAEILNNHAFPRWGNTKLTHIKRSERQAWINTKRKKLSRWQTGHIKKVTGAVLQLAEDDEVIAVNPMR